MANQETKNALAMRGFTKPINEALYDYLTSRGALNLTLQEKLVRAGGYRNIKQFMLEAVEGVVDPVTEPTAPPTNLITDPGFLGTVVTDTPLTAGPPVAQEPPQGQWYVIAPVGTEASVLDNSIGLTGDGTGYPTVSRTPPLTVGTAYKITVTVLLGIAGSLALINGTETQQFADTLLGEVSLTFTAQTQSFTIKQTGIGLVTIGGITVEPV